jgi:hypothetical protein
MNTIVKAGAIVALVITLSGCLATVATIGAGLATGVAAGCSDAEARRSINSDALSRVCGSAFAKP